MIINAYLQYLYNQWCLNGCFVFPRYAHPSHASPGHPTYAGECPPPLLLRLLHLRHHWGPALGGVVTQPLLPRSKRNICFRKVRREKVVLFYYEAEGCIWEKNILKDHSRRNGFHSIAFIYGLNDHIWITQEFIKYLRVNIYGNLDMTFPLLNRSGLLPI